MLMLMAAARPARTRVDLMTGAWVVPPGLTSVLVYAAGRGGFSSGYFAGGGGGWIRGVTLPVTPGDTLRVVGGLMFNQADVFMATLQDGKDANFDTSPDAGTGGDVGILGMTVLGGKGGSTTVNWGTGLRNGMPGPTASVGGGRIYAGGGGGAGRLIEPAELGGRGGSSGQFSAPVPGTAYGSGGGGWVAGSTPSAGGPSTVGQAFFYLEY